MVITIGSEIPHITAFHGHRDIVGRQSKLCCQACTDISFAFQYHGVIPIPADNYVHCCGVRISKGQVQFEVVKVILV